MQNGLPGRHTNGWRRGLNGVSEALLPMLRAAGIEYEFVREGDVRKGGLDRYRGLLLISQQVMTRGVFNAIEAYAAKGHKVWMTDDSAIKPAGAEILAVNGRWSTFTYAITRIQKGRHPIQNTIRFAPELRATMGGIAKDRAVSIDTPYVVSYEAYSGDTRYAFVVNTDIYGARTACITLPRIPRHAFELTRRKPVKWAEEDDRAVFSETLDAGDWRIYAFPPTVPKRVKGKLTVRNHVASYELTVVDADRKPVTGAWPLEVSLIDQTGKVRYTRSVAMTDTRAAGEFNLSLLTDPENGWTLQIEELVMGRTWKWPQ